MDKQPRRGKTQVDRAARKRTILLGYDGTPASERALERVAELAQGTAQVTVISVAASMYHTYPSYGITALTEEDEHKRLLSRAKRRLARRGIKPTTLQPVGDPGREILEAAQRSGADLIVVGGHDKGLLGRLLWLEATDTEVVRKAPCDVLVVR